MSNYPHIHSLIPFLELIWLSNNTLNPVSIPQKEKRKNVGDIWITQPQIESPAYTIKLLKTCSRHTSCTIGWSATDSHPNCNKSTFWIKELITLDSERLKRQDPGSNNGLLVLYKHLRLNKQAAGAHHMPWVVTHPSTPGVLYYTRKNEGANLNWI
jgi:hypothetical protein